LDRDAVRALGANFTHTYVDAASVSPAAAVNAAVRAARGPWITVCIDGARILSPGILAHTMSAVRGFSEPVVTTLAWHLGPEVQYESLLRGYNQDVEDQLLAGTRWQDDGYELFRVSCLAQSSGNGWFLPFSESNCLTVSRALYEQLGGLDEQFTSLGGGFVNLDYCKRACETRGVEVVVLLGEGTFHQFHGGVATNTPGLQSHIGKFAEEYERLRGAPFSDPLTDPIYLGRMPPAALPFLELSAARAAAGRAPA
jgi:hypothetical protein